MPALLREIGLDGRCKRLRLLLRFAFRLLLLLEMLQTTEVRNEHHLIELVTKFSDEGQFSR